MCCTPVWLRVLLRVEPSHQLRQPLPVRRGVGRSHGTSRRAAGRRVRTLAHEGRPETPVTPGGGGSSLVAGSFWSTSSRGTDEHRSTFDSTVTVTWLSPDPEAAMATATSSSTSVRRADGSVVTVTADHYILPTGRRLDRNVWAVPPVGNAVKLPLPRGIDQPRPGGRFRARISLDGRLVTVGNFDTVGDAEAARTLARADATRGTFRTPDGHRRRPVERSGCVRQAASRHNTTKGREDEDQGRQNEHVGQRLRSRSAQVGEDAAEGLSLPRQQAGFSGA